MSNTTQIPLLVDNFYKAASVTLYEDRFVKMSADDKITPSTGATDLVIGVLLNTTTKTTVKVAVGLFGIFQVELGGTGTRGTFGEIVTNGRVQDATPANAEKIVCMFLQSGTTGEKVRALVFPNAMPSS